MTFSGGGRPEGLRRSGGYELGDSGRQPRARNKGRAREGAVGEVTWAGGARRGGEAGSAMRGAAGAGRGRGAVLGVTSSRGTGARMRAAILVTFTWSRR